MGFTKQRFPQDTGLNKPIRYCVDALLCDNHEGIIEEECLWIYIYFLSVTLVIFLIP
jgi:hypothetical protein